MTKFVISTTGEIPLNPARRRRSVIQTGDLAVGSIPRIRRPANRGQPAGSTNSTGCVSSIVAATGLNSASLSVAPVSAATSRAIPRTLKQSPRFGVRSRSMTASGRSRRSTSGAPTSALAASSMIPSDSSPSPSSMAEHSMPFDTTPRIFALRSFIPFGSFTPGFAKGVFIPCRTFGAPQTMSISSSPPSDTLQTLSLSASGCLPHSITSAMTTSAMPAPSYSIPSTSWPSIVS